MFEWIDKHPGLIAILGSLVGWAFSLGIFYNSSKNTREKVDKLEVKVEDYQLKMAAHAGNGSIHRDPERDVAALTRLEVKLDKIEEDVRNGFRDIVIAITQGFKKD